MGFANGLLPLFSGGLPNLLGVIPFGLCTGLGPAFSGLIHTHARNFLPPDVLCLDWGLHLGISC